MKMLLTSYVKQERLIEETKRLHQDCCKRMGSLRKLSYLTVKIRILKNKKVLLCNFKKQKKIT